MEDSFGKCIYNQGTLTLQKVVLFKLNLVWNAPIYYAFQAQICDLVASMVFEKLIKQNIGKNAVSVYEY